jgi:alpha-beta hydrolase superfamily lysophospholipase
VETDLLGAPYQRRIISLDDDTEGPVTATLVHRFADPAAPTGAAVLYLHGFVDYFFQTHLADFYVERGIDFYALDLRKYGRSLASHQTPNHCHHLEEYYPEIDEAVRLIREVDGHDRVLVNGHSTGGLIAALWAADHGDGLVDALFLNSPFLELIGPWAMRRPGAALVSGLARYAPDLKLPFGLNDVYGRSIHHLHDGAWQYDLAWKPLAGFPVRTGWLRAIRDGHRRVRAGLDLTVPVLVAASTASYPGIRWGAEAQQSDSVLNVVHMARWAATLGRCVTLSDHGGLHDLTLSAEKRAPGNWADVKQ